MSDAMTPMWRHYYESYETRIGFENELASCNKMCHLAWTVMVCVKDLSD